MTTKKEESRQAAHRRARIEAGWLPKNYLFPPAMAPLLEAGAARYGSETAFLQHAAEVALSAPGDTSAGRLAQLLDGAGLEIREKGGAAVTGDARPGDDG